MPIGLGSVTSGAHAGVAPKGMTGAAVTLAIEPVNERRLPLKHRAGGQYFE